MSKSRGGWNERKRSRGKSKSEHWRHDMFGPEEVKQRGSGAESRRERDEGRRRETSHVQSHSPPGCTHQHTPSIIWLQLTHTQTERETLTHTHSHTSDPPNGLLHSPFPYNPCMSALLLYKSYVSQEASAADATTAMTDMGQCIYKSNMEVVM